MPTSNILLLDNNSPLFEIADRFAIKVYFLLIVKARHSEDGLCTPYDSEYADNIIESLQVLKEHSMVEISDGFIYFTDADNILLANKGNPFQAELSILTTYYDTLKGSITLWSPRFRDNRMLAQVDRCWLLLHHPDKLKKINDLIDVYKGVYILTTESVHRELTGKEAGQFKQLLRFYNIIVATKMCIHYLFNEERAPSVGFLLTNKDQIYHNLVKSKKSASNVTGSF